MKNSTMLTVSSLLSILLFSIHMAFDIVHGVEQGDRGDFIGTVLIALVWLDAARRLLVRARLTWAVAPEVGADREDPDIGADTFVHRLAATMGANRSDDVRTSVSRRPSPCQMVRASHVTT